MGSASRSWWSRSAPEPAPPPPVKSDYVETRKGYPETLTEEQRGVLGRFRVALEAEGVLTTGNRWDDDHELCRWLRARQFNLDKTMVMVRNHVKWEAEFGVDRVYAEFRHTNPAAIKEGYPRVYHGVDRTGRPINIDGLGRLDIKKINAHATDEQMLHEKVQEMEHTLRVKYPACSRAAGRVINQSLVIMDLQGLGLAHWNSQTRAMVTLLTGILSDHYPETMGGLFIINAPAFFTGIWTVVKLLLDPGTTRKIKILSTNYQEELFKEVDPVQLPRFLGGTDDSFDFAKDQGPWTPSWKPPGKQRAAADVEVMPARRRRRCLPICCGGGAADADGAGSGTKAAAPKAQRQMARA